MADFGFCRAAISAQLHVRLLDNEIENVGHCGIKTMEGGNCVLIEGNFIHDTGLSGLDHNIYCPANDITIRRNLLLNSKGYGLHAYSHPTNLVADHNIIAGANWYGLITCGPNARIGHNVFYQNQQAGLYLYRTNCFNGVVVNNVFIETRAWNFDGGSNNDFPFDNLLDYNLFAPGTAVPAVPPGNTSGAHNLSAEPQFNDSLNLDFTPQYGSPLIDAGVNIGDGNSFFGSAADIGLYELPELRLSAALALEGSHILLSWPALASNVTVQVRPSLSGTDAWQSLPAAPSNMAGRLQLLVPNQSGTHYFRLKR